MSGSDDERVDPRVDRTRDAALRAVRELLIDEGWEAITQHRVAERSGVGRTTVYRHWPDRVDMVREAFELELHFTHELDLTGDLRADLILAAEALRFEMIDRFGTRILIAMIAHAEWDEKVSVMKKALVDHALRSLRTIAEQAIRTGKLEPGMTVDRVVSQVFGPMVMERLVTDATVPAERVPQLVDAFLRAHAAEPPP